MTIKLGIKNPRKILIDLGYLHRQQQDDYILTDINGRYHVKLKDGQVALHYDLQGPSGMHITNIPMPIHMKKEQVRIQKLDSLNRVDQTNKTKENIFMYDKAKMKESTKLFLEAIGHPADDPNIAETPERIAVMNEILFAGYRKDPRNYIKTFPNPNPLSRSPVILGGMEFYSTCAHHGKDFYGKATIGYVPGQQVLGLSKFGRIMRIYAGRLQLQEQMTNQIADALFDNIDDIKGVMVMVDAKHLCVSSRGVRIHDSFTRTEAIRGTIDYQKVVDVHRASSDGLFAY